MTRLSEIHDYSRTLTSSPGRHDFRKEARSEQAHFLSHGSLAVNILQNDEVHITGTGFLRRARRW